MAAEIVLELPLPPSELSPNARVHWARKNRVKREYQEQIIPLLNAFAPSVPFTRATVRYEWHSTHHTDADNGIARMKAGLDAMQGRLIENDRDVQISYAWERCRSKAAEAVFVTVTASEEQRFEAHDHGGMRHEHFTSGEHDHR